MFIEIGILVLLLLMNGFLAMSELAIVSARRARLKQAEGAAQKNARWALALQEDPTTFLSFIQIGMTLNSVLTGAFSGATLGERLGDYLDTVPWFAPHGSFVGMALTVAAVTYLNLVIGELLPKRVGLAYAEDIALKIAPFFHGCVRVSAPLVWLLKRSTDAMLALCRIDERKTQSVTEDEVKDMIAEGTASGVFKPVEKKMLEGVMRLADRPVRSIMTPRIDVVWLDGDDSFETQARLMKMSGYSRFPMVRGDWAEILGVVDTKDLLIQGIEGKPLDLMAAVSPPLKVPDTASILRLLEQFKQSGQQMAVVIDEYGSVEGIVTATDILEAITGEIPSQGNSDDRRPVRREDGSWLIDGMTPIDEVEILLGLKHMRDGEDFHTMAGFVIDQLGRVPAAGDHFHWNGVRFEVVDMDARRVDMVLVSLPPAQDDEVD